VSFLELLAELVGHRLTSSLGLGFSLIHKERRPTKITDRQGSSMILVGDVTDRVCIIIDDLIDTGNTVRICL
jgi:ribose-phosphate pyrophosphokinase